jgi:hypothetical protein
MNVMNKYFIEVSYLTIIFVVISFLFLKVSKYCYLYYERIILEDKMRYCPCFYV